MLSKVLDKILQVINTAAKLLVVALTLVVSVQVVTRFFGVSLQWTVELSRFLFAWLGFLGLVVAMNSDSVPRFTAVIDKIDEKYKLVFMLLTEILVTIFLVILFFHSFEIVQSAHGQKMSILPLQWSYVYISFPFSLFFMITIFFRRIYSQLKNIIEGRV